MQTVTRQPSKRSKKPPIKEVKAVGSKKKATPKPVVDVPKDSGANQTIALFVKTNKPAVKKYLENEFDGVTADLVNKVTQECAECAILKRSPKKSKLWTADIIEEVISKACKQVKAPAEKKTQAPLKKKAKSQPKKATTTKKAATAKKTVKKTASKKTTTKKKVTKKATSKKAAKKVAKKPTTTTSEVDVKSLKGVKQWEGVALNLKHQKKIWIQAQDIPAVMGALYKVHQGKAKLPEEGLPGLGEKSYGKRRCVKMLTLVKDTIASL